MQDIAAENSLTNVSFGKFGKIAGLNEQRMVPGIFLKDRLGQHSPEFTTTGITGIFNCLYMAYIPILCSISSPGAERVPFENIKMDRPFCIDFNPQITKFLMAFTGEDLSTGIHSSFLKYSPATGIRNNSFLVTIVSLSINFEKINVSHAD
jgi:hypothetical protein